MRVRTVSRAILGMAVGLLLAIEAGPAPAAESEPYPSRPIRLVVPAAPGAADFAPRLLGRKLSEALGQPVVVENRPGAAYNVASDHVAKSAPDGYTILYTGSVITILPSVMGAAAVDPSTAFVPIAKVLRVPMLIVANRSLGVNTLPELLARARMEPGRIAYASPGIGTVPHLTASVIAREAGVELMHVPYANSNQAIKDVVSGEVPVYLNFIGNLEAHIRTGNLVPLAVAGAQRIRWYPDLPTVAELGYPEAAADPWSGFVAPAGTPREIIDRLNLEINRVLAQPDVREQLAGQGMEPLGSTPEQLGADVRAALARWPAIVRAAGIRRD